MSTTTPGFAAWYSTLDGQLPVGVLEIPGASIVARSEYVETFYLPTLGPSATWLLRRLATTVSRIPAPNGVRVEDVRYVCPLTLLARSIGLGDQVTLAGPLSRSLQRLIKFRLARVEEDRYRVAIFVPRLTPPMVRRLPANLAALHDRLSEERRTA